jgi:hypothetical protein
MGGLAMPDATVELSDIAGFVSRDINDILPSKLLDLKKSLSVPNSWVPRISTDLEVSFTLGNDHKDKENPCKTSKSTTKANKPSATGTSHGHPRRIPSGLRSKLAPNLHIKANLKASLRLNFNPKTNATQTKKAVKRATRKAKRWIRWGTLCVREGLELFDGENS